MGVKHVGLGSDFDGIETVPTGLENIEYLPRLIDTLENKGFSLEEIAKIMGNNIIGLLKGCYKNGKVCRSTSPYQCF